MKSFKEQLSLIGSSLFNEIEYYWNAITTQEIKEFAGKIKSQQSKHFSNLYSIKFAVNNLDSEGLKELINGCTENKSLDSVSLKRVAADGQVNIEVAKALAEMFKQNNTITSFEFTGYLCGGGYKDSEITETILSSLKYNKTITLLNLEGNIFGPQGAKILADVLKENSTITSINFKDNYIDNEGAKLIIAALKENSTITYLNLESNDSNISSELMNSIDLLVKGNEIDLMMEKICSFNLSSSSNNEFKQKDQKFLLELLLKLTNEEVINFNAKAEQLSENISFKDHLIKFMNNEELVNEAFKDYANKMNDLCEIIKVACLDYEGGFEEVYKLSEFKELLSLKGQEILLAGPKLPFEEELKLWSEISKSLQDQPLTKAVSLIEVLVQDGLELTESYSIKLNDIMKYHLDFEGNDEVNTIGNDDGKIDIIEN